MSTKVLVGVALGLASLTVHAANSFDAGTGSGFYDRGDVVSIAGPTNVPNNLGQANFRFIDTVYVKIECSKETSSRGRVEQSQLIEKQWDRNLDIDSNFTFIDKKAAKGVSQTVTRWTFSGYTNPYRIPRGFCNSYNNVNSGWTEKSCTADPEGAGGLYFENLDQINLSPNNLYLLERQVAPSYSCLPL